MIKDLAGDEEMDNLHDQSDLFVCKRRDAETKGRSFIHKV